MINNNSLIDFIASVAVILPSFLIALSFHEFAHALVSYLLGDDTAKKQGRLTINPLAHMDLMGTLFLLIFRIGWARPVPFNMQRFRHPRLYSILTAFAGPVANFILAYVFFVFMKFFPQFGFSFSVTKSFMDVFQTCAYVNVMLGTFNLLPIPPLDGSHLIFALLYNKFPNVILWLYRYSMFIVIILFLFPYTRIVLIKLIYLIYNFIGNLVF